jgi:hypothetical protein
VKRYVLLVTGLQDLELGHASTSLNRALWHAPGRQDFTLHFGVCSGKNRSNKRCVSAATKHAKEFARDYHRELDIKWHNLFLKVGRIHGVWQWPSLP